MDSCSNPPCRDMRIAERQCYVPICQLYALHGTFGGTELTETETAQTASDCRKFTYFLENTNDAHFLLELSQLYK